MPRAQQAGQALVEYALVVAAISIVMALLLYGIGTSLLESTAAAVDGWL